MRKFVSCVCICLALVVAVMPLCAFKCADVPNAPAMVDNRLVMASNRPFVQPLVAPPTRAVTLPSSFTRMDFYLGYRNTLLDDDVVATYNDFRFTFRISTDSSSFMQMYRVDTGALLYDNVIGFVWGNSGGNIASYYNQPYLRVIRSDGTSVYWGKDYSGTNSYYNKYYYFLVDFNSVIIDTYTFYTYTFDDVSSTVDLLTNPDYIAPIKPEYLSFVVPEPEPEPTVIETLIDIMISGITSFAENIGKGINDVVVNVFVDTSQETFALTTFGGVVAVFAGLALAVGLSKVVSSFIMRLGGKE